MFVYSAVTEKIIYLFKTQYTCADFFLVFKFMIINIKRQKVKYKKNLANYHRSKFSDKWMFSCSALMMVYSSMLSECSVGQLTWSQWGWSLHRKKCSDYWQPVRRTCRWWRTPHGSLTSEFLTLQKGGERQLNEEH